MNDSEKKKCLTLYNYYNSAPIDSFNPNKCNDINLSIVLNINTLKNNYKIKKEVKNYTNTNIFCYKENENKNTNYNANNENENNEPNENTNSYNLKNLKGILKQYFEELYINKTIIQNDDNIQTLNITKNDKQQTIIFTPIFLSNNETVISYIITFNNKSYNYTYVFLLYDFYNTDLQFNDFIPMIKNKEILSKKINGEKQNQDSLNHSVSSVHNIVQQVLTNSPALLLHLLLKSNKFQFKNVCDTSLIFNTIIDDENENLNLYIDNDKNYEKKFTICSKINDKENDGATLSVCRDNKPFYNNIRAFFESDKRIFIGFIKLLKKSWVLGKIGNSSGHNNMFIIDKERKIIIQFEPKGHDVISKASFNKLDIKTQFLQYDYLNVKLMEGGYKFLDTSKLDSISAYCYKHNKTDIYYLNQNKNSNSNLDKKKLTFEQSFIISDISKSYHDNNCQSYTFCGVLIYCLNPDYIGHPKNLEVDKNLQLQLQLPLLLLTKYGITYEKVFEFRELLMDFYDSSTNLINTYNKNKNLYFEIINKDKINNNIPELSTTTIKELNENFTDEELSNNFIKINSKIDYKNIYVVKHKYYNTPIKVSKNYIKSIKYINSVISNIPKLKVVFNIDKYEKNKYAKPIQMLNINDLDFEKILKYLYLFNGDSTIEDFIEIYNYMINLKKKSICDILKDTNISNNKQTNKRPNHKQHNNKTRKQKIGNLNNNVNNINNNVNNTRNTDPSLLKKIKNIIYILGLTEEKLLNTIIYNFITSLVTIKNNLKKYYPHDYCFYSDNNFKDYIIKLGKIKVEKHETLIYTHTQFTEIIDKHNNYSYIFIEINDKKELDNDNNLQDDGNDGVLL